MGQDKNALPVWKLLLVGIFFIVIFGFPIWMLVTDAAPALAINEFQEKLMRGSFHPPLTLAILMLAVAAIALVVIYTIKIIISFFVKQKRV